jgi:hypothetical protein
VRTTRIDRLRKQLGIPGAFIFDPLPIDPMPNGTDMTINSTASVPTAHASRYLQQLCKHWSHNLAVEFDETKGTVTFPHNARGADWPGDATLVLKAENDTLECRLEASAEAQREALKGVVSGHLDRFAFREAPLQFDWQDA